MTLLGTVVYIGGVVELEVPCALVFKVSIVKLAVILMDCLFYVI